MGASEELKPQEEVGGKQVDKPGEYGLRFTVPDLPPGEQIDMAKGLRDVVTTFARAVGEEADTKPFDEVIAKLEADIAVNDLELKDD